MKQPVNLPIPLALGLTLALSVVYAVAGYQHVERYREEKRDTENWLAQAGSRSSTGVAPLPDLEIPEAVAPRFVHDPFRMTGLGGDTTAAEDTEAGAPTPAGEIEFSDPRESTRVISIDGDFATLVFPDGAAYRVIVGQVIWDGRGKVTEIAGRRVNIRFSRDDGTREDVVFELP